LSITAAQYLSSTWSLLLGAIIFVVIRFAPGGLWFLYDRWWARRSQSAAVVPSTGAGEHG
jgi:uncharacterized membrane protein YqiK